MSMSVLVSDKKSRKVGCLGQEMRPSYFTTFIFHDLCTYCNLDLVRSAKCSLTETLLHKAVSAPEQRTTLGQELWVPDWTHVEAARKTSGNRTFCGPC